MKDQIETFARVFGIPSEVLDVIGRDYVSKLVEEMPVLYLPAVMSELRQLLKNHGQDWVERNVSHLKAYFLQLRRISEHIADTELGYMEILIESAAARYRVSREILYLVGMDFLSQVISEFPGLLLPPIMQTLKHNYVLHGLDWFKENAKTLQEELLNLKKLYGPTWILA
jgi:hypothetical protein